ncbi:16S rRNA (uracil(1498)-N(3))-methyltransferase [Arthrobacter cryoconiti]|uniref:Ribosomal RNA small subunit methyltransferase E n=1 Tax=Arthrobacter cryoconiti TaxID=748907 RepID=A0ABV8QX03_9MICC|nr:16S rRNA (uracil(1498)-N(3))-methyltransferase [Arthrobacter cryoconiti]MCC9069498.1 16S rRNA (uracil(1498)-N(3))-methyltransferase [Arthrobacter cryoconiti]
MSNPVFYADPVQLAELSVGDHHTLDGAEGRHAVTVKRLSAGEPVDLCDGAGRRLVCVVAAAAAGVLDVEVKEIRFDQLEDYELVLVQALAKGDRDELAVETVTELGVNGVVPWQAERSIVRWKSEKALKGVTKWRTVVAVAAKQARRSRIPWVGELVGTAALCDLIRDCSLALILHEDATESLPDVLRSWQAEQNRHEVTSAPVPRRIVLIVGPEGGMSPAEVSAFRLAGARTALLGPHVLRSSTAGPAAVVLLSAELGRW